MYEIKTITIEKDIDLCAIARIEEYNWGGDYRPITIAKVGFIEEKGFIVKMECVETNPLATVVPPFGHVCIDSCMEFFANFLPNTANSPYINFEANSLGAVCCEFSEKGGLRPNFDKNGIPLPKIEAYKTDTAWGFIMTIDFQLLNAVYGDIAFKKGDIIRGNFYKCGDKTEQPHYGSYTKIESPYPSFHCPQFFADMIIV